MLRLIPFAIVIATAAAWAQDPPSEDETAPEPEATEAISEEDPDDFDIDSQEDHTEEDEDIFTPTDVVSFEQSVMFPVDI